MPELPEVETTLRGIAPHIQQKIIKQIIIRNKNLRWQVPKELNQQLPGQKIQALTRRGKYILINLKSGTLIIHLGMSGSLRILPQAEKINKHDHIDIIFNNNICLRYTDPRRFGCFLWAENDPEYHPLLKHLGPEPLENNFNGKYLLSRANKRKMPIKNFIMDSKIVVGVGNIYANEALFLANIHPQKAVKDISLVQFNRLANSIKKVLRAAIKQGGTTLRNFTASDGKPGYFKQKLQVYGRENLPCLRCKTKLTAIRIGQRASVYCKRCLTFS